MEEILLQAERLEENYDWVGASQLYRKALDLLSENDFLRKGNITERLGCTFHRFAFQAENSDEFRERIRNAVLMYEEAKELYGKSDEQKRIPRMFRCDAMVAYLNYWVTPEVSGKKRMLGECWELTKRALNGFREAVDVLEYAGTYSRLSKSAALGSLFEWDFDTRKKMLREAVEYGEEAIKQLSSPRAVDDSYELAKAYVIVASFLESFGYNFLEMDERERYFQKAQGYWQKANELSEETAMVALLDGVLAIEESLGWFSGSDKALTNFGKALEYARKTKDRLIVGVALDNLAYHTLWRASSTEEPDAKLELLEEVLQYAKDAKRQYSPISFISPYRFPSAEHPYATYKWARSLVETNLEKKRSLLEEIVEAEPGWIKTAEDSGYPEAIEYVHHGFSVMLTDLAKLETNSEKKKHLLEKALEQRNEAIKLTEQFGPFQYWNQGLMKNYLSDIQSELAVLTQDPENRKNMIEEAATNKENASKLFVRASAFREMGEGPIPQQAWIGSVQSQYGDLLKRLYECTGNTEYLRKAAKTFEEAAERFQKLNLMSRMAECYWKIAQVCDILGEHLTAAENFGLASNNFRGAEEKIPQLRDFYEDYALYMQAWSQIEKARHCHERQEYGSAKEHYEKAACMYKSLKQWSYYAPNYLAWSHVENAEDLSRNEQNEQALQIFEQAAKLFTEAKKSFQKELDKIENLDEKTLVTSLVKATDFRHKYCMARASIEEARVLDKKGDHYSSSEKYNSAVETLDKITQILESEQDRKELELVTTLSRAWQRMTRAEFEVSPKLYIDASELFEQAKDLSPNEKSKMLVLGHSRFCKALAAGTRFADTRDSTQHTIAIQHLEIAADYYLKAGFQNVSEYAKATELLLDAYVQMDDAKKETDPEKKARLYTMAEKVLQSSAESFTKASYLEKKEQVQRLLEKVRGERELAVSLSEVLHAPSIVSATTAFPTPISTQEKSVGLEEFEHAHVQTNLIAPRKNLQVDDNFDLEIELTNAGRGPALLTRVEEVVPEGFELSRKPEIYRLEDSYLNLKGKRLDPLKTEEIKLVLKPRVQGVFSLKPKILYLDEDGKYRSNEPESVIVTVKELGIKGWLKGR